MLPKKHRTDKKLVGRVFKNGRFINSSNLRFKFIIDNDLVVPRVSFVVPKNIAKLAFDRNSLRRCGYNALASLITQPLPKIAGVFVFRKFIKDPSILKDEIKNILSKIN
ncbi:MAG: ribonuclease P protein component [Patescibacteria group bacterium]